MKIIELGNIDVQFICPKCHTIFEVSTKELERTGPRNWSIGCPLCRELITIGDGGTIDFLIKREELKNK